MWSIGVVVTVPVIAPPPPPFPPAVVAIAASAVHNRYVVGVVIIAKEVTPACIADFGINLYSCVCPYAQASSRLRALRGDRYALADEDR